MIKIATSLIWEDWDVNAEVNMWPAMEMLVLTQTNPMKVQTCNCMQAYRDGFFSFFNEEWKDEPTSKRLYSC